MDIFLLHTNFREAACALCDKDLTSAMRALEQTLKGAHERVNDPRPFPAWVQASLENYAWAASFFVACCDEYTYRYERQPRAYSNAKHFIIVIPTHLPAIPQTPFPKIGEIERVTYDRSYYGRYRQRSSWTKRNRPAFFFRLATLKKNHGTFHF